MRVKRVWLSDFRSHSSADVDLSPGLTVVVGPNGTGKTNLLEAVAWLATAASFRGVTTEALIRRDAGSAVIRAEIEREGRELLIEAELSASGRNRVMVNRQPLRRARDLIGGLSVSVFTPDDLVIVKGGPGERRRFLDETLVRRQPKLEALRAELERVLRQRNTLLKQVGGRLDESAELTLDVWDSKLTSSGEALAQARLDLLARLRPEVEKTYALLSGRVADVDLDYRSDWREEGLAKALANARRDDLRRGVSTVGPHRDDVALAIDGLPSRTHASQGEQRTVALALRLAAHRMLADEMGTAPVLLLDDVFSELDAQRSTALLDGLPDGQVLLTTAGALPPGAEPDATLEMVDGAVRPAREA